MSSAQLRLEQFNQTFTFTTGSVTTGSFCGGGGTASVGTVFPRPTTLTGIQIHFGPTAANVNGVVIGTFTLYKNANSGSTNRCFVVASGAITSGTGQAISSTTVVDAGMNVFNGTTDYYTIAVTQDSTSFTPGTMVVTLTGTHT